MKCIVCDEEWCWICRIIIEKGTYTDYHFEFYNVFGCPGLRNTPNYFLVTMMLKVLVSLLFPITLLFAPLVVALRTYPIAGQSMFKD